jgi:hypothetical protein
MLALQIAIGFGIAIIFPLLVYYGVSTFHPAPQRRPTGLLGSDATPEERKDHDERRRQESERYDAAAKAFSKVLILTATPLGVAAIGIGAFLSIHAIGTGLVFGGIAALAFGYWTYWRYLEDWIRFVSLLAGFAMLLLVGFRLLSGS